MVEELKVKKKRKRKPLSEETKRKISEKMKGPHNPMYGKKLTPEERKKISDGMKGKPKSEEHKKRISETMKGRPTWIKKGTKFTEEHRRHMSEALKGKRRTEEFKRHLSEIKKGRPTWIKKGTKFTEEHRRHISEGRKGIKMPEAAKQYLSKLFKGRKVSPLCGLALKEYWKTHKGLPGKPKTWEHRIKLKNLAEERFKMEKLVKKLTVIKEIENLFGIKMGLNSGYKNWHKPLKEGKTLFHQGYYRPKYHPEKCLTELNIFRSSWEAKFFDWCDRCSDVIRWASEPTAIQYRHPTANLEYCLKHGLDPKDPRFMKIQNYYMDVWIELRCIENNQEVIKKVFIEIKPYDLTIPPVLPQNPNVKLCKAYNRAAETYLVNKAKWDAARKYCTLIGCEFWIITEKELKTKFKLL